MTDLCIDVGWNSVNKDGEQLCGDHIELIHQGVDQPLVFVLADGLGSGVKASILSTLTAKIISTMMADSMSLKECVATMASTLPVCQTRGIAYSTFTIIRITDNRIAEIIQYDNPHVILLRDGKNFEYQRDKIEIDGKTVYQSKLELQLHDVFVVMSDGAVYAGVGDFLNFGWQRENIIKYLEKRYQESRSAKSTATMLLEVCNQLYDSKPGDDTTIGAIKVRKRSSVNLLIGPPQNPADDEKMVAHFFSREGKHIISGGTTSSIAARYLGKEIQTQLTYHNPEIPPIAYLEGIDLVTEGVITINKVLHYAKSWLEDNQCYTEWSNGKDGASLISKALFEEATDIHFFVGRAVNSAHQNPDLPIHFSIKMRLIDELADCLKSMGKGVEVSYY